MVDRLRPGRLAISDEQGRDPNRPASRARHVAKRPELSS